MPAAAPLISVIMPVRNGMPFIADAVQSILSQTVKDFEILIVNDASTDGTTDYVASLHHPAIRMFNSREPGISGARETGLNAARGRFFAHMDADDISLPRRFEAQLDFLAGNPGVVAVGTQVQFLVDGVVLPAFRYPEGSQGTLAALKAGRAPLCDSSAMLRGDDARSTTTQVKNAGCDFDFYLRLARRGELANIDEPLFLVRLTQSSTSFVRVDEQLCAMAFSLACDRAYHAHRPEPGFDVFCADWRRRPVWRRMATKFRVWHQRCFRRALIHQAHGRRALSLAEFAASAALYPRAVEFQLRRLTRSRLGIRGASGSDR